MSRSTNSDKLGVRGNFFQFMFPEKFMIQHSTSTVFFLEDGGLPMFCVFKNLNCRHVILHTVTITPVYLLHTILTGYLHTLEEITHISSSQEWVWCMDTQPWCYKHEHSLKPHDPWHIKQSPWKSEHWHYWHRESGGTRNELEHDRLV